MEYSNECLLDLKIFYHMTSLLFKKKFFLTRELSLSNTCCWRADHEILMHDGTSRSELIFVAARQHVLISDISPVRKNYFDSNIIAMFTNVLF